VTAEFSSKFGNTVDVMVSISSDLIGCVPKGLVIHAEFPYTEDVSQKRMINFTIVIFLSL